MIHFDPVSEPAGFDAQARQPGNQWLAEHPDERRPKDYWSPFRSELRDGFHQLCAYSVQWIPDGEVDHFLCFSNHPALAYEWSNYRYASSQMNRLKGMAAVLDPFEIEDDWFEIILPSLQLVMTERIPMELREKARFTLNRLHLEHDERAVRTRREFFRLYEQGDISLQGLYKLAPLIARAVEKAGAKTS